MTLQEFLTLYDKPGTIVILEGKRQVLKEDELKIELLGNILASQSKHIIFRSGNAKGADMLFTKGICSVDATRMQVVTPYDNHRQKTNKAAETYSIEALNIAAEPEVLYHSKSHKKTEDLVDKYVAGNRDRYAIKAAYIIRDTVKVLGSKQLKPASFGIFYDDLNDPEKGGTGHTMHVCRQNNVRLIDQRIWFNWL